MTSSQKSDLVLNLLDASISSEEFEQLQHLMRTDTETKEIYHQHIILDHSLDELMGEKVLSPTAHKLRPVSRGHYRRAWNIAGLAAAACLMMGLMIAHFLKPDPIPELVGMRFSQNTTWSVTGGGTSEGGG